MTMQLILSTLVQTYTNANRLIEKRLKSIFNWLGMVCNSQIVATWAGVVVNCAVVATALLFPIILDKRAQHEELIKSWRTKYDLLGNMTDEYNEGLSYLRKVREIDGTHRVLTTKERDYYTFVLSLDYEDISEKLRSRDGKFKSWAEKYDNQSLLNYFASVKRAELLNIKKSMIALKMLPKMTGAEFKQLDSQFRHQEEAELRNIRHIIRINKTPSGETRLVNYTQNCTAEQIENPQTDCGEDLDSI